MRRFLPKLIVVALLCGALFFMVESMACAQTGQAIPLCGSDGKPPTAPTTTVNLAGEIDEFFAQGAVGYLVWQYSGDAGLGTEFASDPYAFFRNKPEGLAVCETLKAAAGKHPGKFVGVNMWDAGNSKHSEAKVAEHFKWLKDTCGVTVVRTFSKEGGADGARKLISAAGTAGIKVMFAIGDYSNGGGGIPSGADTSFYTSGYSGEFQSLASAVVDATKGSGSLYGYELANEAHCRGDQAALSPYRSWGEVIGGILRGGSPNVGYGQKASENTTLCDSPGIQAPSGVSHFEYTNAISQITMTSGHYYNTAEKSLALLALAQSKGLNKPYYVGEAPAVISPANAPYSPACISPEKYYIQPINGVNGKRETLLRAEARALDPNGDTDLDIIRDELIMQGYEARCAAPGIKITLTESGRDAMEKLFVQPAPNINGVVVGGGGLNAGGRTTSTEKVYSHLDVDYQDILVPLFRDLDRTAPELKRSIEDFFGFREANDTIYTSAELKTAAINSLLSNQQRCTVAYENLRAQDEMCRKLEDPQQCALYATKIPQTTYTVKTLFQEFERVRGATPVIEFCQTVMGAAGGVEDDLRVGMANAPLTIEKAYRLAFMVTSIRLRNPNPSVLNNLFTHPLGGWLGPPKPNHAIAVVAFKIPDLLTNKGFNDGYTIDTAYSDVGTLTKNSLITEPTQAELAQEAKDRRRKLLAKAREMSVIVHDDSWAEISCLGGGVKTTGVGSPQCKDPLSKALVDIINAQVLVAPELDDGDDGSGFGDLLDDFNDDGELKCNDDYETGVTINDPGAINAPDDPSHVFTENYGAALLANLFGDCTHAGEGKGSPSYASTQDPTTGACDGDDWFLKSKFFVVDGTDGSPSLADNDGDEDGLAVKHFLVYPSGYELRTVEGVLAGSFFTKQQLTDILELQGEDPSATQKMVDQFRLEKSNIGFTGGQGGYSYRDEVRCPIKTRTGPDGLPEEYRECPTRSFDFRLVSDAIKSANILGGKLGYWMRKVQLTLNATTQMSHSYLTKCASLEEFLLDRCGGGVAAASVLPPGQSVNPPRGDGQWVGDTCVSSTKLEDFDYYGVSQLPTTGKATYYGLDVFNGTLNTRLSGAAGGDFVGNTTLKNCELTGTTFADAQAAARLIGQEYVGCVALLRVGDLYYKKGWGTPEHNPNNLRSVWLKNSAGEVHGPFAVLDVSAARHAPCHYDQNWAVDIDFNSFERLFKQTGGPDQATVCDTASC